MKRRASTRGGRTPRTEILEAAARVIATHGYHGMSMRDLARATGRSAAGFYNHFRSKEELLFALQADAFETLVRTARDSLEKVSGASARLYAFLFHHVRYVAEHPDVMRVLIHEAAALPPARRREVRTLKERYFRLGRELLGAVIAEGCKRPGARGGGSRDSAELERATYCLFGMLNWVYGWYDPQRHGSPSEVARTIHRIALCGLLADCPHRPLQDEVDRLFVALRPPPLIGRCEAP
jgi:AcrR family transcriptional regulator